MNKHIGSTLDSMFEETGELDEVNLRAQKRGVVNAVLGRMDRLSISKASLARRMQTSRSQVERLLDPNDISLTLATLFVSELEKALSELSSTPTYPRHEVRGAPGSPTSATPADALPSLLRSSR